jgi:hypothetical protein
LPLTTATTGAFPRDQNRIEETMTASDTTLIHAALEVSGGLLYAVTAMIIVLGLLVVAFSFRGSQQKD